MIRYLVLALIVFSLAKSADAVSKEPWNNKKVVLEENLACQTYPFDGGFKPNSRVLLRILSDRPVWVLVHDGQRFIRENYTVKRKLEFSFVGLNSFAVSVCRERFNKIQKFFKQQSSIENGAIVPVEEVFPDIDDDALAEFNLYFSTN